MSYLRHVVWRYKGAKGRVAVFFNDVYIEFKAIGGANPPVELVTAILDVAIGRGWRIQAEKLFRENTDNWRMRIRRGMSGCQDWIVERMTDQRLKVVRVTARFHISMFGKVSWFEGDIGELAPILAEIERKFPTNNEEDIEIYEVARLPRVDDFTSIDDTPPLRLIKE
jgi:hypothetical protein